MSTDAGSASGRSLTRRVLTPWTAGIGAVVAVAATVAVVLVVGNGGSSGTPTAVERHATAPTIVSAEQLRTFAHGASGPIYWVGRGHATTRLELTTTAKGNVFIRYLTGSAVPGDPQPNFTTVGTYGLTNAYKVVLHDGRMKGASLVNVPGGGIAERSSRAPDSYYVAFPGQNFVAEVFDKSPKYARRLVTSGRVAPVR